MRHCYRCGIPLMKLYIVSLYTAALVSREMSVNLAIMFELETRHGEESNSNLRGQEQLTQRD